MRATKKRRQKSINQSINQSINPKALAMAADTGLWLRPAQYERTARAARQRPYKRETGTSQHQG
ncbi:hypothetical protein [Mucilaginibacter paludis]|uniref:hypothetical protein n=1 Tax=Mucilaginibacter paludis TaxID=423351 RepID=UPI0002EAD2C1|nr:hypothetical protein [Mucilaginibacter paludis]